MSEYQGEYNQDLFYNILQNRPFEPTPNVLVEGFIKQLSDIDSIRCSVCNRRMRKVLFFFKGTIHCVGCFCTSYENGEGYLTVDLNTKLKEQSILTLFDQLDILNQISACGVENCQQVARTLPSMKFTQKQIEQYRKNNLKIEPNSPTKTLQAKTKEPWMVMSESFTNSYLYDYHPVDYMLAYLNENSTEDEINNALAKKISDDQKQDRIRDSIQTMAKQQFKAPVDLKEIVELEPFNLINIQAEQNTDVKELQQLLEQADQFIQRFKGLEVVNKNESDDNQLESSGKLIKKSQHIKKMPRGKSKLQHKKPKIIKKK